MRITLVTVGKLKEKYLRDAVAEYAKRLGKYCKLEIIEVADEKTAERASEAQEAEVRAKEGERILKHVKEDAYVITLEILGKQAASEEFADKSLECRERAISCLLSAVRSGWEKRCLKGRIMR